MTEGLKDRLSGPTKKRAVLGSGRRDNQTTGGMKTVCILWVPNMVILGMMCHAKTATTLLVSQVQCSVLV